MNKIEEVAVALIKADGAERPDLPDAMYDDYLLRARYAIEAMMEPSEGMLKKSFADMNATPSGEWKRLKAAGLTERQMFDAKMRPRYAAMIRAALEEK